MIFRLQKNEAYLMFVSLIFFAIFIFLYYFNNTYAQSGLILIARDLLLLYILLIILFLHKTVRYIHSIYFFIGGFVLFYCSRILLSYSNINYLYDSDKYSFYSFSNETVAKVIILIGISIIAVCIGFFYSRKNGNSNIVIRRQSFDEIDQHVLKYLKIIILLCVPGLIYKSLYDLYLIKTYGYLILYMEMPKAPLFARISWGAFNILFPILLMFAPEKRKFKQYILLFFLVSFASFLQGSRGTLLRPMIFFIWYYYALYSTKDISLKKIVLLILFVAVVANVFLSMRNGTELGNFNIILLLEMLLVSQGVTYVFLGNYFDYVHTFLNPSRFYILFPLVSLYHWFFTPVYRGGQTTELVQQTLNLDDQLMYSVNPDLYLEGVGYGSSYIAELFSLGGVLGVVVGSFILGYMINWFECYFRNNHFLTYFSWFWIPNLIWMSRSSYLPDIVMPLIGITFYYFMRVMLHSYLKYGRNSLSVFG